MNGTLFDVVAVAVGGSLGAVARFELTRWTTQGPLMAPLEGVSARLGGGAATGTTLANLIGCLLLGMVYQYVESSLVDSDAGGAINPRLILLMRVGFLGSLTTFSTWAGEITLLGTSQRFGLATALLTVNLVGGCLLFLLGCSVVRGAVT